MSGTDVTAAADGVLGTRRGRREWLTPVNVVIGAATLLALGLRVYQLAQPGFLLGVTQYDDGPYFGSAVRLLHGILPYRDFVLVQPPGITLLMLPAAALSKVTGTAWGMAAGRILTTLASTAAVVLAGLLVRHRGVLAATITCGILAVYPPSVSSARTVLVEPWLVMFCLAGAVAVFNGDRLTASRKRLVAGGAMFGFAGAVETWAIVPVIVIFALLLAWPPPRPPVPGSPGRVQRSALFAGAVGAAFAVPVLPFAALSPHGFYQSLIVAQLVRVNPKRTPVWPRLRHMIGLTTIESASHVMLVTLSVLIVALVVLLLIAAATRAGLWLPPLEWFVLATAILVVAAFLWTIEFYSHFPAFLAPFLAMAIALPASRLLAAERPSARAWLSSRWPRWVATSVAGLLVVTFASLEAQAESHLKPDVSPAALAHAQRVIPPGACVVTDQVSFLILANRFSSTVPGCSPLVDSIGTDYALSNGRNGLTGAGEVPAVAAVWRQAFAHAQYAWLSIPHGFKLRRIAWDPALTAYFRRHFVWVFRDGRRDALYARRGLPH